MGTTIQKFAKEMSLLMPNVHREFLQKQARVLKTRDISFSQLMILHILKDQHICNMTEIAKIFSITTSAATGIVDRMVRSGLLKRTLDPGDRRVIRIKLTLKGKKTIILFLSERKKMIIKIFKNFSASERETYLNMVKKIHSILTRQR